MGRTCSSSATRALASCIIYLSLIFSTHVDATCTYTKTNGFLDCRNRSLSSVPAGMAPFTKIVDLSYNKIGQVDRNSFNTTVFVTEIYLAGNNLSSIEYATFAHLEHLRLLDLSHNRLTAFQADTPVSLEILYLDDNPLAGDSLLQRRIHFLKYLSVANANFTTPPAVLFSPFLPVLEYLDLRDNNAVLAIGVDDLAKLKQVRVLYLSARVFVARGKIKQCEEFVREARRQNIEVKAFACYPKEPFQTRGRFFERTYPIVEAMPDHAENILVFPIPNAPEKNDTLHDLQKLVSEGMANFVRSLIAENTEARPPNFKIKDLIRLEDYFVAIPRARLFDLRMSGFPLFNMKKEPILSFSTVDAEYIKQFNVEFKTADPNQAVVISGRFEVDRKYGNFTCEFSKASYRTKRDMVRRYDFRIWPQSIYERLDFEKMDCSTSLSNQYSSNVVEMTILAMCENWLDSASNVGGIVTVQPAIRNISLHFAAMYRDRVLVEVIEKSFSYLERINVDSFEVTPTLSFKENGLETSVPQATYDIRIVNLFKYESREIKHRTATVNGSMRIFIETVVGYKGDDSTKLAITAKSDPSEMMQLYINKINFNLELELKRVNRVFKLFVKDVNVKVLEKEDRQRAFFVLSFVKKYVDIELAKEFKRSLTFLTDKVDFYSLNVD